MRAREAETILVSEGRKMVDEYVVSAAEGGGGVDAEILEANSAMREEVVMPHAFTSKLTSGIAYRW